MKFSLILFLVLSSYGFSQSKIDSIFVYSSSLEFYLGKDPYEYTLLRFPREKTPLIVRDSLKFIELALNDTLYINSTKKGYVYFILEVFSDNKMTTYFFDDKKYLYFDNKKYKKMKDLYEYIIENIELEYNRTALEKNEIE